MRYSKQREEIYKIIQNTDIHPNADWIFKHVKKKIPKISLGTVYRNLKLLVDSGKILAIHTGTTIRYDGNIRNHIHLKCTECGNLIDVDTPDINVLEDLYKNYEFEINGIELTILGKCCNK